MNNKKRPASAFEDYFLSQSNGPAADITERIAAALASMNLTTDARQLMESGEPPSLNVMVTGQQLAIANELTRVLSTERNIALWNAMLNHLGGNTPENWAMIINLVLMVGFGVDTRLNLRPDGDE